MKKKKRRNYSADFKARVALAYSSEKRRKEPDAEAVENPDKDTPQ